MENAADALKIAFALLIFAIAITIVFTMISKIKTTADTVLYYADDTNYQQHINSREENRTVKKAHVISTLYRYYKESISVTVIINGTEYVFDKGNETNIFLPDKTNINTEKEIEANLAEFITNRNGLGNINEDADFLEEFVEVPTSGIYLTGDDGSEITLSAGGKKVYVIYTKL